MNLDLGAALARIRGLRAEEIPALLSEAASLAGLGPVGIYLADLEEQLLQPWPAHEPTGALNRRRQPGRARVPPG